MFNAMVHRAIRRTPHELDVIDFIGGFQARLRLAIFQIALVADDTGKTNRKGNANLLLGPGKRCGLRRSMQRSSSQLIRQHFGMENRFVRL